MFPNGTEERIIGGGIVKRLAGGADNTDSAARQQDPTLASVTVPLDNGLEVTSVLTDGLLSG